MTDGDRINVNTERENGGPTNEQFQRNRARRRGHPADTATTGQTQRGTTETDAVLIEITETGLYKAVDWPNNREVASASSFSIEGERGMTVEDPKAKAERMAQERGNVAVLFIESNTADPLNVRDLPSQIRIDLRGVRR